MVVVVVTAEGVSMVGLVQFRAEIDLLRARVLHVCVMWCALSL